MSGSDSTRTSEILLLSIDEAGKKLSTRAAVAQAQFGPVLGAGAAGQLRPMHAGEQFAQLIVRGGGALPGQLMKTVQEQGLAAGDRLRALGLMDWLLARWGRLVLTEGTYRLYESR